MDKTRLSLYYLATYLLFGGFGLLLTPRLSARLLMSNANYDTIILQVVGMLMTGFGLLTVQFIRLRVYSVYPSTLIVLSFFCVCLAIFYLMTTDPFFLIILAVVLIGVVLTGLGVIVDRRNSGSGA